MVQIPPKDLCWEGGKTRMGYLSIHESLGPITKRLHAAVSAPSTYRLHIIHNTIRAMMLEGAPYWKTDQFKAMTSGIDMGLGSWGCRTRSDVSVYFHRLRETIRSMERDGYQVRTRGDTLAVLVDEFGNLVHFQRARHRLRIAELLGLPAVPCQIVGAHVEWLRCVADSTQSEQDLVRSVTRCLSR